MGGGEVARSGASNGIRATVRILRVRLLDLVNLIDQRLQQGLEIGPALLDAAVQLAVDRLLRSGRKRPAGGLEALVVHLHEALEVLRQHAVQHCAAPPRY